MLLYGVQICEDARRRVKVGDAFNFELFSINLHNYMHYEGLWLGFFCLEEREV
jgi:hypothetical protein